MRVKLASRSTALPAETQRRPLNSSHAPLIPCGRAALDAALVTVTTRPFVAVGRAPVTSFVPAAPMPVATTGTAGEIGCGWGPGPRSYARANVGGAGACVTYP